ncbi:ST3 beta-galactoside alpha-2,3-sialyltransferase 7 [Callorhinchus milii]|uniref:Lactosylceramide alpha-2,3-sialyltransferase n=1 Tax=Callorhinchus milii TaxID=7868 RepID=K4GJ35_CALMI|nr:ST3 beta-galactoside alpha-2,3-sialyltransferase 7 [Callorhinchus milii]AFM87242.1 lactosylceramide alpha-2,3-sialyltransferase-like protein [Callorhinchus milii]
MCVLISCLKAWVTHWLSRNNEMWLRIICRRPHTRMISLMLLSFCYMIMLLPSYYHKADTLKSYTMAPSRIARLHNQTAQILAQRCRPNSSQVKLYARYPTKRLMQVPVFVEERGLPGSQDTLPYKPPYGFQGCEEQLQEILSMLPETGLPERLGPVGCRRCVVVGNGGILIGSKLGPYIDQHHIVIRMNNGPVVGYEQDVGSETTLRITYPEGASKTPIDYDPKSLFVAVIYKSADFAWLKAVVSKKPMTFAEKLWFWQSVVESIPLKVENFRIFNLDIIRETALNFLSYPDPHSSQWKWMKHPTLGVTSIITALHLRDEVNMAGFGYDMNQLHLPMHYYETVSMAAMNAQAMHDISLEKLFLLSLVTSGVVNDLTGGIN